MSPLCHSMSNLLFFIFFQALLGHPCFQIKCCLLKQVLFRTKIPPKTIFITSILFKIHKRLFGRRFKKYLTHILILNHQNLELVISCMILVNIFHWKKTRSFYLCRLYIKRFISIVISLDNFGYFCFGFLSFGFLEDKTLGIRHNQI